jgi:protein SCO1/2
MPQTLIGRIGAVISLGLLLAAMALAGAWYFGDLPLGRSLEQAASGKPAIGGPFELVDQEGRTRRDEDFHGRYMLIYFGYTYCPDICPTTVAQMTQALDLLAEEDPRRAERVVPVFITVDPERDTVEALADYAPLFHPELVALTGTAEQVADAASAYRVFYQRVESEEASDYLMDHSSFIFVMDPEGDYLTHFNHLSGAEEIAAGLAQRVRPAAGG